MSFNIMITVLVHRVKKRIICDVQVEDERSNV